MNKRQCSTNPTQESAARTPIKHKRRHGPGSGGGAGTGAPSPPGTPLEFRAVAALLRRDGCCNKGRDSEAKERVKSGLKTATMRGGAPCAGHLVHMFITLSVGEGERLSTYQSPDTQTTTAHPAAWQAKIALTAPRSKTQWDRIAVESAGGRGAAQSLPAPDSFRRYSCNDANCQISSGAVAPRRPSTPGRVGRGHRAVLRLPSDAQRSSRARGAGEPRQRGGRSDMRHHRRSGWFPIW